MPIFPIGAVFDMQVMITLFERACLPCLLQSKLMVIGIDVYHDPARGKKSIGAFIASMNK